MNVRTLCLSILHEGEASGYEIRKLCTEGKYAYFVEASYGSIYPALAKLEKDALVVSRVEHQAGKPSKKVFSITQAGRTAFVDSLFEPVGQDVFRSPFMLFARFAHLLPQSLVEERVQAKRDELADALRQIQQMREDCNTNDAWVLRYGVTCLEAALDALDRQKDELIAQARPDEATAAQ